MLRPLLSAAAAALAAAAASAAAAPCQSDEDCNLNGACSAGACACFAPWGGATCGELQFLPIAAPAIFNGYPGASPNASAWGGNAILYSGQYHLFVAEMAENCTLAQWQTNSRCVHAVSSSAEGPYAKTDVAVPVWCHLPQASLVLGGGFNGQDLWALWHAGLGTEGGAINCSEGPTPGSAARAPPQGGAPGPSSVLHVANSPFGPWQPVLEPLPDCWTPSQVRHANGTWFLICGVNDLYRAPNVTGPYTRVTTIPVGGTPGTFEDPYLYIDLRGNWHAFFHTYTMSCVDPECNPVAISGHSFSRDGLAWNKSSTQPFFNTANVSDGSVVQMSTRERPKLIFDDAGNPTHLATAACPMPNCPPQAAIQCKVKGLGPHEGYWTKNLIVPLVQA